MKSFQKSYLRSFGQLLRPAIHLGKDALDEGFLRELNQRLEQEELVKVKFTAHKDKKRDLSQKMAEESEAELIGMIGHNVLLFRQNPDPDKRQIELP